MVVVPTIAPAAALATAPVSIIAPAAALTTAPVSIIAPHATASVTAIPVMSIRSECFVTVILRTRMTFNVRIAVRVISRVADDFDITIEHVAMAR
eukprot:5038754-Pleurochrysis_carterae.AAC.1